MNYQNCGLCPRKCGANRSKGQLGYCKADNSVRLARAALHHWEEPCISGTKGSGTVFFSFCNLGCLFCQNYMVSRGKAGRIVSRERLAQIFLEIQSQGAHNLNLVTPTHYLPDIIFALNLAKTKGFNLPVVYNSGGYESLETLETLQGMVDIFLPDLKFASLATAKEFANAPDYFQVATSAIRRMVKLIGNCEFDPEGLMKRGVIVRHLVLPGKIEESRTILKWIKNELPEWVMVSLMGQYLPIGQAVNHPKLGRKLTANEYEKVVAYLDELGLENGYVQELSAATEEFIPEFDLTGV
ncbi:MAG: radical SAM protein [Bacteroidota bacterium]